MGMTMGRSTKNEERVPPVVRLSRRLAPILWWSRGCNRAREGMAFGSLTMELRAGMFRLCIRSSKMLINGHLLLDQLVIPLLIVPE